MEPPDVPPEVTAAARAIEEHAIRQDWADWELMGVADRRLVHKLRAALKIATDTLEVLTNEAPFTTAWAIKKINATIAPENHP